MISDNDVSTRNDIAKTAEFFGQAFGAISFV